jgi:hypothetical protein
MGLAKGVAKGVAKGLVPAPGWRGVSAGVLVAGATGACMGFTPMTATASAASSTVGLAVHDFPLAA